LLIIGGNVLEVKAMEKMDEIKITEAIFEGYMKNLHEATETDAAVVGAGPAGMTSAYYLAKEGVKTVIFERKLCISGGMCMWGGGMGFSRIVVQEGGRSILNEFGVSVQEYKEGYWIGDAVEAVATIASKAIRAGARLFDMVSVEDVVIRDGDKISGLVLNWSSAGLTNLHIDPLTIRTKMIIDATGHDCEVCRVLSKKIGLKLKTETEEVIKKKPMWAEVGEKAILENTKEIYPGLIVAGMSANVVFGSPRIGQLFGTLLVSGKKAAEIILEELR
jgi:thiamine thiazole synthase